MAVNNDNKEVANSNDTVVKIRNWREARLCVNILTNQGFHFPNTERTNLVHYSNAINSSIKNNISDKKKREEFIAGIQRACVDEVIPESAFEWIKDNPRACYWIWYQVCTVTVERLSNYKEPDYERRIPSYAQGEPDNTPSASMLYLYSQLKLNLLPSSHQERFNSIIDFFDLWPNSYSAKSKYLLDLKQQWSVIFNMRDPFHWLNENDNPQCLWAWEYVSTKIHNYYIKPLSSKDYYNATYALFDTWSVHFDTKRIFFMQMSKAWGQKKYRDGLTHKVALNTYLDSEVKMKLDSLAKEEGKKINEMITSLINNAFARK
ncbi:hypothetical protein [Serratia oryzae]|uniref:Uncharacterized protein n=1 Tax=Serratia oryzae TaxID=2034155 RepID=A0A1S8CMD6_9GAMM|nr:hypothetical protein [Serratia oryzae]OMQ24614.1 hypothetical protein BMI79_07265 [Serratia oryzae]